MPKPKYILKSFAKNEFVCQVEMNNSVLCPVSLPFSDPSDSMNDAALHAYRWFHGGHIDMHQVLSSEDLEYAKNLLK
jgi:hypothetical protein